MLNGYFSACIYVTLNVLDITHELCSISVTPLWIAYRSAFHSRTICLSPKSYLETFGKLISIHSTQVKEIDRDQNEANQLVCLCQNQLADKRTVCQMTSGSMTFNPKPTTRHVYHIPDLFGQVHFGRSIKTLFWYLEPLLLHQPPNLIVPKKNRTRTACTCKISAWRNNDVRLPVSILSTVIWHVNSE